MSRVPEHRLVARAAVPAERVGRLVIWPHIGLDFDDASPTLVPAHPAHEHLAQEVASDLDGFAVEELLVEDHA